MLDETLLVLCKASCFAHIYVGQIEAKDCPMLLSSEPFSQVEGLNTVDIIFFVINQL